MLKGSYNWREEKERKKAEKRRSKAAESLDGIVKEAVRQSQIHEANGGTVHNYTESEVRDFPTDGATALKPEAATTDYDTSSQQPITGNVLPFATQENKAVTQGGGSGFSGGGTTTVREGFHFPHIPRWAAYTLTALVVLAGGGTAAYEKIPTLRNFVDTQYQQLVQRIANINKNKLAPVATVPVATPPASTAPAISPYRQYALEQIAAITEKEPALADAFREVFWMKDDAYIKSAWVFEYLSFIKKAVENGSYSLETLVTDAGTTTFFSKGDNKFRREAIAKIAKASIPTMSEFLGVKYENSLLIIDTDATTSQGGGGFIWYLATDNALRNKTHEVGHEVYGAFGPEWLVEGVAEFAGTYAASRLPETMPDLESLAVNSPLLRQGNIPNFEERYKQLANVIDTIESTGEKGVAMGKGFVFLYEFRELVGQEAFANAMGYLNDISMVRRAVDANSRLTEKDIEAILVESRSVPTDKLPQFKQLYQHRVYDVHTDDRYSKP